MGTPARCHSVEMRERAYVIDEAAGFGQATLVIAGIEGYRRLQKDGQSLSRQAHFQLPRKWLLQIRMTCAPAYQAVPGLPSS